jgi:hypothetical protein
MAVGLKELRMQKKTRIDCRRCTNFHITWDEHFPFGCKLFEFKSRSIPSQSVQDATGGPCEHFKERVRPKERQP